MTYMYIVVSKCIHEHGTYMYTCIYTLYVEVHLQVSCWSYNVHVQYIVEYNIMTLYTVGLMAPLFNSAFLLDHAYAVYMYT